MNDYRNTQFCSPRNDLLERKSNFLVSSFVSRPKFSHYNKLKNYKKSFGELYDCKCGYCGLSLSIFSQQNIQLDHFVNRKHKNFKTNEDKLYKADNIYNIIYSCAKCNSLKSSFDVLSIDPTNAEALHPDHPKIATIFRRNEQTFEINIAKPFDKNKKIMDFYIQMQFDKTFRKLDFLLMTIDKFINYLGEQHKFTPTLSTILRKLTNTRNTSAKWYQ